jgi:hypothetical protein
MQTANGVARKKLFVVEQDAAKRAAVERHCRRAMRGDPKPSDGGLIAQQITMHWPVRNRSAGGVTLDHRERLPRAVAAKDLEHEGTLILKRPNLDVIAQIALLTKRARFLLKRLDLCGKLLDSPRSATKELVIAPMLAQRLYLDLRPCEDIGERCILALG